MKNLSFEEIKESVFDDIIKRKEKLGLIRTTKEREIELNRLQGLVDSEVALKPNIQSGRTDIIKVNDDLERTQIDLLIRFKQMDNVFTSLDRHKELNNAIIGNLKTNMATLTDTVMRIKDTALLLSDDVIHVENFRTSDSISQDASLYTDDYGQPIDYSFKVDYDETTEAIKIPKLVTINKLIASNGQKMATIEINKQIGSGLVNIKNPNNSIDKAIDTDMTTYWEENILADEPVNVELDEIKYHRHNFGTLCEIELIFSSMTEFNEIKFTPYGSYPIDILCIKAYSTDQPDREEDELIEKYGTLESIEIISPKTANNLNGYTINDSVAYQFPTVLAKRVRVTIAQRHYIKNSFIYDKNQYEKNELWFAASDKANVTLKAHQQGAYNVKAILEKQWVMFTTLLNKVKKLSNIDIESLLFPKQTKLSPTTKYEYSYGLYNIGVNENNYKNVGVYVSNLIKISSNIGAIVFDASDEFDPREHEIKYFISFTTNPGGDDWLRVYSGHEVNLLEMLSQGKLSYMTENEKFFGTRGTSVQLSHIPFLYINQPSSSYIDVTISTPDGNVLLDGRDVVNVTNYSNPMESYKNFSDGNVIQYYFYNDKVYFNKAMSNDYIIEVNYKHFIDSVRVKAVFRRKDNSQNGLTPVMDGYKLTFKTIR